MANKINVWIQNSSKIIHRNPWYRLREDDVTRPNGTTGKYFVVDGIDSVAVIAKDTDNYFYLVEQTRYPIGNIKSLEFVTGGIQDNKNPLLVAKQELKEEIGATAEKWVELGFFYPINGYGSEKCFIYLAENLTFGSTRHEETEDISIRKLKLNEIIDLVRTNEISDGHTLNSLLKYTHWLQKEKED